MFTRFRHRRINAETRLQYRETFINAADLIWPVFIVPGKDIKSEIESLPGVFYYSTDRLLEDLKISVEKGLSSILLFGVPDEKGISQILREDGLIQAAIKSIRKNFTGLEIMADVCLCSYAQDGHCHIGDNDETCKILAQIAVSYAYAGADVVAPSDMMDGRVFYIKKALLDNRLEKVKILSYAAKFASNFYGPFRAAANCAPSSGDRKTYQMDYANSLEALEEIAADIKEGADQIMLKPALAYLDIVAKARNLFNLPLVAYNVSGEYRMVTEAIKQGYAGEDLINETLVAIKRAGADRLVTYFVPYFLEKIHAK